MFNRCWPFTSHQSRVTGHARIGAHALALLAAICLLAAISVQAAPREREPNSSYAERRAKVRAQADAPVVIFGYTGREDASPAYVFQQEHYFYYLTGHNEEGAALVLHPEAPGSPREIFYLPPRNPQAERWNGVRLGPEDPDVQERTGFATVKPFSALRGDLEALAKQGSTFYTLLPVENAAGYPHRQNWLDWLKQAAPNAQFLDVTSTIAKMRQIKSPSEMKLLTKAIEASIDAHLEAMRRMRPGIWEYEVAAKMEYIHKAAGCEAEGYAPIVGSGFNSTVLHYAHPVSQIKDGDVVVLDVGGQYSGYVADITRTLPANGKFTPRQREIYEVVLGAQNAVLAALKPGMSMGGPGEKSLGRIATEYMNAHGKDKHGEALGKYFIHGLGHHIGLNVHDVGPPRPLEPGMVLTIEPGIYIPDENLGVRIEDIVLITETGYKLLTERLPRTVEAVERAMASGKSVGLPAVIAANVPFYPPLARQARISGVVELRISTDGTAVSGVQVESGHPILAAAAVGNVRTWQFRKHTPVTFKSAFRFQVLAAPDCQMDSGVVQLRLPTEVEISAKPVITCDPAEVRALKQ